MKAKDWEIVSGPIGEVLVGFRRVKGGFVKSTGDWTVACLYFDSSSYSRTTFFLNAFALPLFVPAGHLFTTYGFRVGNSWEGVDNQLVTAIRDALPKLLKLATLREIVRLSPRWKIDAHHLEARLGAGIILDDRHLVSEVKQALPAWPTADSFEQGILDRCTQLLDLLVADGRDGAVAELARRRELTLRILK